MPQAAIAAIGHARLSNLPVLDLRNWIMMVTRLNCAAFDHFAQTLSRK
jgi:hypothetical protein